MTKRVKPIPADNVQTPRPTEDPPLSPGGDDAHWRENLDAGDNGPTTAHEEDGWRAAKLSKP